MGMWTCIAHYEVEKRRKSLSPYSHLDIFKADAFGNLYSGSLACFEHSNFFKVNVPVTRGTQLIAPGEDRRVDLDEQ
jgi:hypothetical protein